MVVERKMDNLDKNLLALLRQDGRASHSALAHDLKVTRATVRARMTRLEQSGQIEGFTVLVKGDLEELPVRAFTMLKIEGGGTNRIIARLNGFPHVQAIHSTNGNWDLVVECGTETLPVLDNVLAQIRSLNGIISSETSILLDTKKKKIA